MFDLPSINDITTTYPNPPQFKKIAEFNRNRNYKYPEEFYKKQAAYYKDLRPLLLAISPTDAYQRVDKIARAQSDWEIINSDEKSLTVEAVATTSIMQFKDDVIIEIRSGSTPKSCTIHMRSKSRLGRGDLGANAARIKKFFSQLQ